MTTHISRAVKGKVQATIGDVNEMVLDALALRERSRVYELGRAKLVRPRLLAWVGVDCNDPCRPNEGGSRDYTETDGTAAEDGDVRAL